MLTPEPVLKFSVPPLSVTLVSVGRFVPVPNVTDPPLAEMTGPSVSPVPKVADPPVAGQAAGDVVGDAAAERERAGGQRHAARAADPAGSRSSA